MWRKVLAACLIVLTSIATGIVMAQETTPEATESSEASSPSLVGVTWQWEHFASGAEEMDVPTPDYTITFMEDGIFHAQADCNLVNGSYSADNGTISIMPGPSTMAMCPPGSLGNDFTRYLSLVAVYSFTEDGKLLLEIPADSGTLTFSAQPQVTGSVTYRERMALPPDAVVRVQIQDVSIADALTTIIGEQVIVTDGAQVPFPFAVSYPASAIQENRRYSLAARITDGEGKLLFISDTNIPVITGDNPTSDIEIVLVRVGS
jgi:putative lipoprotein